MVQIRLQPCEDYDMEHCRQALRAVCGDLNWVKPGMKIGVKVNLVSGAAPEKAVTEDSSPRRFSSGSTTSAATRLWNRPAPC